MKWEDEESRSDVHRFLRLLRSWASLLALSAVSVSACGSAEPETQAPATATERPVGGSASKPPSAADLAGARQIAGHSAGGAGTTSGTDGSRTAPPATGSGGATAAPAIAGAASAAGSGGTEAAAAGTGAVHAAGSGGATEAAGAPAATAAVQCPDTALAPGDTTTTLQVGGMARTFSLHVPKGYTGESPVALVLDWHGLGSSGAAQKGLSGYEALSDQEGFIVAWANGLDNAWNIGPCCTRSRTIDDLEFARAVVDDIKRRACIDPKRVYADGYSMGGGMSYYLACNAADVFAAVAPSAFDLLVEDEMPCTPARPISVISFRGTSDPIVPYTGGASSPPNGLNVTIHFRGAEETFKHWSTLNACQGEPTSTSGGCQTYKECAEGSEVTLCTKEGGSHDPGDAKLGWEMMKRHPMP